MFRYLASIIHAPPNPAKHRPGKEEIHSDQEEPDEARQAYHPTSHLEAEEDTLTAHTVLIIEKAHVEMTAKADQQARLEAAEMGQGSSNNHTGQPTPAPQLAMPRAPTQPTAPHPTRNGAGRRPPHLARACTHKEGKANREEAITKAAGIHDKYLRSLGMSKLCGPAQWTPPSEEVASEINTLWQADDADVSMLHISTLHNVARLAIAFEHDTIIRLITPQHVWATKISHATGMMTHVEAEPTPIRRLYEFGDSLYLSSMTREHAELRLLTQHLLGTAAGDQQAAGTFTIQYIQRDVSPHDSTPIRYYGKATRANNANAPCPGCKQSDCPATTAKFSMCSSYKSFAVTCPTQKSTRTYRLDDHALRYLFGQDAAPPHHHCTPVAMQQESDSKTVPYREQPANKSKPPKPHIGSSNVIENRQGLTTAQLNFDRTGKQALPRLLAFADTHKVDALLLQDTANCNWSYLALLDLGWMYIFHKSCAILLRTNTAGRLLTGGMTTDNVKHPAVWRSAAHDSMGVTLTTPEGALFLASAYIPTGTDNLPIDPGAPARIAVEAQHAEISQVALRHAHSIISFDGNETITARGRIQSMANGDTRLSGNKRNTDMATSTMGCYARTHTDAHRYLHGDTEGYPGLADMTNTMGAQPSNGIRAIHSKIDYTLVSNLARNHITTCTIHHDPKDWKPTGKKRTNYHASIVTQLKWPALWGTDDATQQADTGPELAGKALRKYPNYARMTSCRAAKISKNVAKAIAAARPTIRGIRKGCKNKAQKRDELHRILTKILYHEATQVLGHSTTSKPDHAAPPAAAELAVLWADLAKLIHLALDRTLEAFLKPLVALDGPEISAIRDTFAQHDISLPTDRPAWIKWWKNVDTHRHKALGKHENLSLSDRLATTNPKQYYRQATRPMSSSKIMSIRTAKGTFVSDKGIETALTEYLQAIGSKPIEHEPPSQQEECISPDTPRNPLLKSVMDDITTETLLHIAGTLDSTSASGYDGIAPALIKIVLTTPWHERKQKTAGDIQQEGLNWKFHTENWGDRHAAGHKEGYHMPAQAPPNPSIDQYTDQMVEPTSTREFFIELLNLCLVTRDLPTREKHGITTGLPKTEGLVTSTDSIRPISVGPAIGRLLNKIIADRLSALLVQHKILNSAQFAFLPGGDIHEPINSVLACYGDSLKYNKACYAVFYDMSKAYDTLRWTSIRAAIRRIGLGRDFEDFVMNSLQGTTLAMRTNLPGRVTPAIEMHKAVKQGCPLAPLLFIIVMDELHTALASAKGYSLGDPNARTPSGQVKSRGYCDDTTIISNSYDDLDKMNSQVMAFFAKHGFQVNQIKTRVTGRHSKDNALATPGPGPHPPGTLQSFTTVTPDTPIKYLGAHITLTLDWKPQIQKMNTAILLLVRHLDTYRTTTLQATCMAKYVMGPRLEIGMRHADVSAEQLNTWDTWIAAALARRAGMGADKLHKSGVAHICRITPLADQNDLIKTTYALEQLTRPSDLQDHYNSILGPIIDTVDKLASTWDTHDIRLFKPAHTPCPTIASALKRLAQKGMRIKRNAVSAPGLNQCIFPTAPRKQYRTGATQVEMENDEAAEPTNPDPTTGNESANVGPADSDEAQVPDHQDLPSPPSKRVTRATTRAHATRLAEEAKRTAAHGTDAALRAGDQTNGKEPEVNRTIIKPGKGTDTGRRGQRKAQTTQPNLKPMMVSFKGISIPTWMTHDLWGSHFDKHRALALAIDKGTAPDKLIKWATRDCRATDTTYHHPDCDRNPPASGGKRKRTRKHKQHKPTQEKIHNLAGCMLTRHTHQNCPGCTALWLKDKPFIDSLFKAVICTDGSTYTGKKSASAIVFCEDGLRQKELWQEKGFYWTINTSNNYHAELSALHRAIRAVPLNVNLVIHTDSLSAVQSINKALRSPERTNFLRVAGRPYVRAICYAMAARLKTGATTRLCHVRAHTGGRDTASIGNAAADRLAKWQAWEDECPDSLLNLYHNDYAYVLHTTQWRTPDKGPPEENCTPVHDDTRTALRKHLASLQMSEWAERDKRGAMPRYHKAGTTKAIKNLWTWSPTSAAIRMALTCLHQVTPKIQSPEGSYLHEQCTRCGTKSPRTPLHRTRGCPHNGPDNRRLEQLIDRLTGFRTDQTDLQMEGSIPTQQGMLPSAIPELVNTNRNAITAAVVAAGGIHITSRTIRYPLHDENGQGFTLDTLTDIGQIALLYTLTTQQSPPPAQQNTSAFHEAGPAAPGPVHPIFNRARTSPKEDRRWGRRCCYVCGNAAPQTATCPIHRVCPQHTPPEGNGSCDFCSHAGCTPMVTTAGSLARTLDRLVLHTATQAGHTLTPTLRDVCRQILRTYSDLHFNPLTSRHPWDSSWHTKDQGCVALGGTYHDEPTAFLTDRYTFVSPTEPADELQTLQLAATATKLATMPSRSVHLMTNTTAARARIHCLGKDTRIHILAYFPQNTLHTRSSCLTLNDHNLPMGTNTNDMILVLLENATAPGFHPSHLTDLLRPLGATPIQATPPWAYPTLPPDIECPNTTPEPPPSHPLLRPSTLFYRGDKDYSSLTTNRLLQPKPTPKTRPADSISNTLCQMGITPPGLQKAISKANELKSSDYSDCTAQITKIIFDNSLALFLRDEGYHKWKRKT